MFLEDVAGEEHTRHHGREGDRYFIVNLGEPQTAALLSPAIKDHLFRSGEQVARRGPPPVFRSRWHL